MGRCREFARASRHPEAPRRTEGAVPARSVRRPHGWSPWRSRARARAWGRSRGPSGRAPASWMGAREKAPATRTLGRPTIGRCLVPATCGWIRARTKSCGTRSCARRASSKACVREGARVLNARGSATNSFTFRSGAKKVTSWIGFSNAADRPRNVFQTWAPAKNSEFLTVFSLSIDRGC